MTRCAGALAGRHTAAHPALRRGQPGQPGTGRADHRAPPRPAPAFRGGRQSRHRVRARLSAGGDPDGHQPARHQRRRSHESPARRPATAHIPIIALSANALPRDIEKACKAGFFNYLTKPIKVDEFMDALDLALKFANTGGRAASKDPGMMLANRNPQRQHPDRRRSGGQRHAARRRCCASRLHVASPRR
jgi:CheY-like chemotaxis protein